MYENVRSCVWVCKGLSDEFEVKFGVHQGSVLSPLLFIIVLDALSREIRRFQLTWNRASLSAFTRKRVMLWTEATTVQSRGFFTSPLTPADNFSKPPADPRTCPLSIPPRDTLIPPRIRRGPAVVPPDTYLIPPRIRGGLTMSNGDVIMIDS